MGYRAYVSGDITLDEMVGERGQKDILIEYACSTERRAIISDTLSFKSDKEFARPPS